jgi:hypothetical protein
MSIIRLPAFYSAAAAVPDSITDTEGKTDVGSYPIAH